MGVEGWWLWVAWLPRAIRGLWSRVGGGPAALSCRAADAGGAEGRNEISPWSGGGRWWECWGWAPCQKHTDSLLPQMAREGGLGAPSSSLTAIVVIGDIDNSVNSSVAAAVVLVAIATVAVALVAVGLVTVVIASVVTVVATVAAVIVVTAAVVLVLVVVITGVVSGYSNGGCSDGSLVSVSTVAIAIVT